MTIVTTPRRNAELLGRITARLHALIEERANLIDQMGANGDVAKRAARIDYLGTQIALVRQKHIAYLGAYTNAIDCLALATRRPDSKAQYLAEASMSMAIMREVEEWVSCNL